MGISWDSPKPKKKKSKGGFFSRVKSAASSAEHFLSEPVIHTRAEAKGKRVPKAWLKGAEEAATGFPSGVKYATQEIYHGRGPKLAVDMGKAQYETARHPLRDPFSTSMLLLALASAGGGAAARGATGIKAMKGVSGARKFSEFAKAASKRPVYERTIKGSRLPGPEIPKSREGLLQHAIHMGIPTTSENKFRSLADLRKAIEGTFPKEPVKPRTSPNPLARGLRKGIADYEARYRPGKDVAREMKKRTRHETSMHPTPQPAKGGNVALKALDVPMDLVRLGMYTRLRTALQNTVQTGAMIGSHQPFSWPKSLIDMRWLAKNDPETWQAVKNVLGDTAARSYLHGRSGVGPLTKVTDKLADLQNIPEANLRPAPFMKELRDRGVPREGIRGIMKNPQSNLFQQSAYAAHKAVGDFGNVRDPISRIAMKSKIPIFWPMFKALTEYTAKFPLEHSIQASLGAQLGARGKEYQREKMGDLPWWYAYAVPIGDHQSVNPGALYNFQPGVDVGRQTAEMFRSGGPTPGLNLLAELGPLAQLILSANTGTDPATGFPLKHMSHGSLLAALADFGENLSPYPLTQPKSFEHSGPLKILGLQEFGSGLVPRTHKPEELLSQARHENPKAKGPRKRAKGKSSGGSSGTSRIKW